MIGIYAWPNKIGTFDIRGKTYSFRNQIKAAGCLWNPDKKCWEATEQQIEYLHIPKMMLVEIEAHCHEPQQIIWVSEMEFKYGRVKRGCDRCDTPVSCGSDAKIIRKIENEKTE